MTADTLKLLIVICTCLIVTISCKKSTSHSVGATSDIAPYQDITTTEVQQLMTNNPDIVLLDVRTPGEIAEGAIEGHTAIDFRSPTFKEEIQKLDREGEYIIYCRSGGRSAKTARMMQDMGFSSVSNMLGGYNQWSAVEGK